MKPDTQQSPPFRRGFEYTSAPWRFGRGSMTRHWICLQERHVLLGLRVKVRTNSFVPIPEEDFAEIVSRDDSLASFVLKIVWSEGWIMRPIAPPCYVWIEIRNQEAARTRSDMCPVISPFKRVQDENMYVTLPWFANDPGSGGVGLQALHLHQALLFFETIGYGTYGPWEVIAEYIVPDGKLSRDIMHNSPHVQLSCLVPSLRSMSKSCGPS